MNKFEKLVYDLVKRTPWIKFVIRNIYQSFFDFLPRKKEYFNSRYQYKENCFFGFHDIDPFSDDCTKVLTNKLSFDLRMPVKGETLEVGYIDLKDGEMGDFNKVGISYAWNYHKGCRLQWFSESEVIYNTAKNEKLVSRIIDINNGKETIIDFPIDTVYRGKNIATSFSYERLEKCMPGYGYPYNDEGYLDEYAPKNEGLFLIDLNTNSRRLLLSIKDLINELDDEKFTDNYWHFITHSEFSEDGRYISFLHRWVGEDIKKRWTRLIIYDLSENKWFLLPTTGWGVSHYVWNNKNQLLAYCSIENKDCHAIFDIPSMKHKKIATNDLNSDGHQSFIGNDAFVTDTYPDRSRMAKLHKVNISTNQTSLIASVYSPKVFQTKTYYKHIACDLHPRVSKNGEYLCFDSPRSGKRSIYVMKLN